MAGKVDELVPWAPNRHTAGLLKERRAWIEFVSEQETFGKLPRIVYSADLHAEAAVKITDAAIYRMIMKESEQE